MRSIKTKLFTPRSMLIAASAAGLVASLLGYAAAQELGLLIAILVMQTAVLVVIIVMWRHQLIADSKQQARSFRNHYHQIEALAGLYARLRPSDAFPATRSWVASPDMLLYLAGLVRREAPTLVLECGSGLSTVLFAYALRELGAGRVIALEHLEEHRATTEQLLADHGVADWAEVRPAPLKSVQLEGEDWPWYDLDAVPDGPLDLVLVDGPPGQTRDHARYPAGPLLLPRLAPGGRLILDDYGRDEERESGERWVEQFPGLEVQVINHEKGTAVFRWAT